MQLPADATLQKVADLAATLPNAVNGGSGVFTVDATALTDCDTGTLALLMQARRAAKAAGRGFSVQGAPAQLRQLAALYGVEELLALSPT